MPINYHSLGEIRNIQTNNCLDTFGRKSGENVAMTRCHGMGGNQVFAYTGHKQIMTDDNCMDASSPHKPIKLVRCHSMGGNQAWEYRELTKQIVHVNTKLCLDKADAHGDPTQPKLHKCDANAMGQKWAMVSNFKWQSNSAKNSSSSLNNNEV